MVFAHITSDMNISGSPKPNNDVRIIFVITLLPSTIDNFDEKKQQKFKYALEVGGCSTVAHSHRHSILEF